LEEFYQTIEKFILNYTEMLNKNADLENLNIIDEVHYLFFLILLCSANFIYCMIFLYFVIIYY